MDKEGIEPLEYAPAEAAAFVARSTVEWTIAVVGALILMALLLYFLHTPLRMAPGIPSTAPSTAAPTKR